jgi:hypothetical protein
MSDKQYDEFVDRLHTKFPAMFSGRYGGIACGSGWWPMIENLCGVIQAHIDHSKGKCPQVIVDQVKEKFGTLRFYVQGGDEFTGGAIWFAESMSGQMCEECGAPGKRHGDGWVRTQCDFHLIEKEALKAQYAKENGLEL